MVKAGYNPGYTDWLENQRKAQEQAEKDAAGAPPGSWRAHLNTMAAETQRNTPAAPKAELTGLQKAEEAVKRLGPLPKLTDRQRALLQDVGGADLVAIVETHKATAKAATAERRVKVNSSQPFRLRQATKAR